MTSPVGGIDPHQDTFTVGIVDAHGIEITHETFDNTAAGYLGAIGLLDAHGVRQVGVEGSAKWGAHVAVALAAAGFDAREVPPSRSAAQRRSPRLDKTDAVDAVASARCGCRNCVVAGQAAFRYSLMSPPQRAVLTTWRCLSGWSAASVATGGR